jgi:O-antigen/teichoic acid export membrane protein
MSERPRHRTTDAHHHLTHVARGGALGLIGAAVSAVAGFGLTVVVTNRFDPHTAGQFFTANSTFLLLIAMTTMGTETGLGRFMLRYETLGRRGDIPPTLRAAVRPTIGGSLLLAVAVLVLAGPLSRLINLDQGEGPDSLRVLALLLPFATWNTVTLAGTRAFGRMRTTVMVDKIFRPSAQPLLLLDVSAQGAVLLAVTVAWCVPYAIAAVVSAVIFRRFLARRGTMSHTQPTKSYRALRREFWSFTWPRSITRISQMAVQRLDIVLVAALRSPTEAAIYTAATRFVALGQFGTQAIQQVLQPRFTALLAGGDHDALREVYQVAAAWSMAVACPMYVVVFSAPEAYLSLFGDKYSDSATPTVLLMAAAMLINVATGAADTLLLMSGRSALSLVNSLVALALDVGLCFALVPGMGITGAAVAWAIASVARCSLALVQIRITLSVTSFGPAAGVVALANLGCIALPLFLASRVVHLHDLDNLVIACALCAPLYLGALWLGRAPLRLTVLRGLVRRRAGSDDPVDELGEDAARG